jgi:hypothetical protein
MVSVSISLWQRAGSAGWSGPLTHRSVNTGMVGRGHEPTRDRRLGCARSLLDIDADYQAGTVI